MVPSLFPHLLSPLRLGAFELAHRVFLPAQRSGLPMTQMPAHYARRSTPGGLLIVEATRVSPAGPGEAAMPGIHNAVQVNQWRDVSAAIHARGGVALLQLSMDSSLRDDEDVINLALQALRDAAENAGDAGFDGVELRVNGRELAEEMLATLAGVWGAERIGLCLAADAADLADLAKWPMAYLQLDAESAASCAVPLLRCGGLTPERGERLLAEGRAVAVGLDSPEQLARLLSGAAPMLPAGPVLPGPR